MGFIRLKNLKRKLQNLKKTDVFLEQIKALEEKNDIVLHKVYSIKFEIHYKFICTSLKQSKLDPKILLQEVNEINTLFDLIYNEEDHNYLLNKNSEYKVRYDMIKGGRIKYYYCQHPKNNVFAYMRSFHPTELTEKEGVQVDYDTQFDKTFLKIVNRFLNPIGLPTINKRLSVLNSLFQI